MYNGERLHSALGYLPPRVYYAGDPQWVSAHVTQGAAELGHEMMRPASEPVGRVGGDQIAAMFLFPNGVHGYFGSKPSEMMSGRRFGLTLAGSKALGFVPLNAVPSDEPWIMPSAGWVPAPASIRTFIWVRPAETS